MGTSSAISDPLPTSLSNRCWELSIDAMVELPAVVTVGLSLCPWERRTVLTQITWVMSRASADIG